MRRKWYFLVQNCGGGGVLRRNCHFLVQKGCREAGFCDGNGTFWCRVVAEAVVLALCQIVGKIDLVSYLNGKGCEMFIYC